MATDDDRWLETGRLAEMGLLSSVFVHELRQPVFAIKAAAQLLADTGRGPLPNDGATLELILQQVSHIQVLIERYAASGQRPSDELQPVQLEAVVRNAVDMVQHRARATGRRLELEVTPSSEPVQADPVALQQITCNLVVNALDASRGRVVVRTAGGVLTVCDDGPPIPAEVRARMFEPFFSTKPPGEGTGLGLAIAERLIQQAGGTLELTSDGDGTCFRVRLRTWGAKST